MTPDIRSRLTSVLSLPADASRALLIGRAWVPAVRGPVLVRVDGDGLFDLSAIAPTASELLNRPDVAREIRAADALPRVGSLADALGNSAEDARDSSRPWLVAPCDLQAVKASGATVD